MEGRVDLAGVIDVSAEKARGARDTGWGGEHADAKWGRESQNPHFSRNKTRGNWVPASGHLASILDGMNVSLTTLYRPVGQAELELIRASHFREFPPRLPEQPVFYPVLTEEYATQIARDWNVTASGAGYLTRFKINAEFIGRYAVKTVGSERVHRELWIPAEDL